jgi:hypothetical protein
VSWQWEHLQQWRPPDGAYAWVCMIGQRAHCLFGELLVEVASQQIVGVCCFQSTSDQGEKITTVSAAGGQATKLCFIYLLLWPFSAIHLRKLCNFWPYMHNIAANGKCAPKKNYVLPICCFYHGTQLNCNLGHYLQLYMSLYLDREENPGFQSSLGLSLFGPDCSLDALFGYLIIKTCVKQICPSPVVQNQVLITTGTFLRLMQFMRITEW